MIVRLTPTERLILTVPEHNHGLSLNLPVAAIGAFTPKSLRKADWTLKLAGYVIERNSNYCFSQTAGVLHV
jgi:hypothetical protein